ncbi:Elongation factor 1-beta [Paramicrosporidium saccamoebae]|uniref:Elongation factor 1-beta n=1 Tax=Paramicrosporidium saccamoebae TaxID=1246581 RepID=A0A2H9TNB9_9FUNG|nr:Elongation factor 1-beta [Paramicrosporidium saccamoebae]
MGFDNLNTDAGIATLNTFVADKSYIEGFTASQADVAVFEAISTAPAAGKYPHAARWLPGTKKAASEYGPSGAPTAAADEDDIDLFGSEDEDPELEKAKAERLAAYQAKKAAKGPGPAAKSSILLDVKPWDDETDMAAMEQAVRAIYMDGLLWGASKLVPIGYGIKKLQISCVVEDDKVGTDMLNDAICEHDVLVQSVDIASFNKI